MTLGRSDVAVKMFNWPAAKYVDTGVHRTHKLYTPATAPFEFIVTLTDEAEFHTLEEDVLKRTVGLVVFGEEQDGAMMKAAVSPDTLGIEAPTTATL